MTTSVTFSAQLIFHSDRTLLYVSTKLSAMSEKSSKDLMFVVFHITRLNFLILSYLIPTQCLRLQFERVNLW